MIRILLLADSHLGFDLPARPRVARRRRGHDFQANFERALEPALDGTVDLVVHGGDVFHRSRVLPSLAYQAFRPLRAVAESGVPVFVVPGNHERSRIPHARFASHPGIYVFGEPGTVTVEVRGVRVGVSGFPFQRHDVRGRFGRLLEATGWRAREADVRLFCVHQSVEGATVGPADFTFRGGPDVVRGSDLPRVAAVLAGHIHRHQVLDQDLGGDPLPAPVLYPGSVERTSRAEAGEAKGYVILEVEPGPDGGALAGWRFEKLPTRRVDWSARRTRPPSIRPAIQEVMPLFGSDGAPADGRPDRAGARS